MDSQTTFWLLGVALVVTVAASIGDIARRRAPLAWYAYVPWNGLVFGGCTVALLATVHLVSMMQQAG